uniref:Uncharacterized protein n=1 Tax=Steinernema glaseri TaxID=37863 RepID=A0A1I7Z6L1_9BILA
MSDVVTGPTNSVLKCMYFPQMCALSPNIFDPLLSIAPALLCKSASRTFFRFRCFRFLAPFKHNDHVRSPQA